jgi:hypothetical protein
MRNVAIFVLCAGALAGAALFALTRNSQTPLALNAGLWEVTVVSKTTGIPSAEDLAQLPPDQRDKVLAEVKADQDKPHVFKECLTEQQLKRGFAFGPQKPGQCANKIVSSTSKVLEVHMECSSEGKAAGTLRYEAVDPATFAGKSEINATKGADTMTVANDMHGKWLGADCGDVKPRDAAAAE